MLHNNSNNNNIIIIIIIIIILFYKNSQKKILFIFHNCCGTRDFYLFIYLFKFVSYVGNFIFLFKKNFFGKENCSRG
jgi:hypothetical protein